MASSALDGHTLGDKHRSYNKLVNEGFIPEGPKKSQDKDDISELLKIEAASKKRDVDYILEVLKSEDELHVSKAIKRSTWLITDKQYAHIINPEHLYSQLRPQMTSRAFNKLMLNIRLHLRDEQRVEEFYNYIKKESKDSAFKWLQHCSVQLVENEVVKHGNDIADRLLLRHFEKSFSIFREYTVKSSYRYSVRIIKGADFIAIKYPEQFLDLLKTFKDGFYFDFSPKVTKIMMEKCPEKILNDFELYGKHLDLATFAKCLKSSQSIEDFLLKNLSNEKLRWLYSHDKIQHFIYNMPKEKRFEFTRKLFIDKELLQDQKKRQTDRDMCRYYFKSPDSTNTFQWYKFAPFETAFTDLKKLIRAESNPATRIAMLQVLVASAGRNIQHMNTLLQYYNDKHINEPFKFKIQFVNYVMSRADPQSLDDKSWKLLNQLFHSMEVYIPSENNVQSCIRFILVRSIIRKENIPEIIKEKFVFDTLKDMQKKFKSLDELDAVFQYLYDIIIEKYNKLDMTLKEEFHEAVSLCDMLLNLINDWKRELNAYPVAVEIIRKLITVNKNKTWNNDLSLLYTKKKSWKRVLFKESLDLLASESVCINALKHDPELLSRHRDRVVAMSSNDTVSLRRFLRKIRLYWNGTLAEHWKRIYLERIEQPDGHKALVCGICILLSQTELNELLKKYAPAETKIDWNDTDQHTLSLRKQIAKNVYMARPLASIEEVLLYAKGDYLQYTVPSISSILSLMSANKCRHIIPVLLDAPVSLQKFGIRCAFQKLNPEELKPMLNDIWNSTKNSSIKTVLFIQIFTLLCKEEKEERAKFMWEILSMLIDKLTADENVLIYQKLGDIFKVPDCVKAQFFMKSYTFLLSLPARCNCDDIARHMLYATRDIMGSFDDDFVVNVLLKNINDDITKESHIYDKARIFSSFILSSENEDMQMRRYQKSLAPILKQFMPMWENTYDGECRVKANLKIIYGKLINDIDDYTFEKKMHIPVKTFEIMLSEIESTLSYLKEYLFLTTWKLSTLFVKILSENSDVVASSERGVDNEITCEEKDQMYNETHKHIAPDFSKYAVEYLKEDLKQFGPSTYTLFTMALNKLFRDYLCGVVSNVEHRLLYAKCLLQYGDIKEVWVMVAMFLKEDAQDISSDNSKKIFEEIREIVNLHDSDEVKMHFCELFSEVKSTSTEAFGCRN